MATEYKLSYTASEIDEKLGKIDKNTVNISKLSEDIADLKENGTGGTGLTAEAKTALLNCFKNVAWTVSNGQDYYDALENALNSSGSGGEVEPDIPDEPIEPDNPEVTLTSISATYNGGEVAVGTSINSLTGITVKAHYSDGTSKTVSGYTLSGTITEGNNTITVSYSGKTTTFIVVGVNESVGILYNWDLKHSLTDTVKGTTANTTANFTDGTGVVFTAKDTYIDFGQVFELNRTYELDIETIGEKAGSGTFRRLFMVDTDRTTASGGAGLILGKVTEHACFYTGSGWDTESVANMPNTPLAYFTSRTLKIYIDGDGYWTAYGKSIGADDSEYVQILKSSKPMSTMVYGKVVIGSDSGTDAIANATFSALRIYEGEK